MKETMIPIVIGALGTIPKGSIRDRICGNHPDYNIIKISQDTEKNPEVLRRLAVSQPPVESHHLALVENFQRRYFYKYVRNGICKNQNLS